MSARRWAALMPLLMAGCGGEPPAPHAVREVPVAGPALAGDRVVWGEEHPDGSLALVERAPGGRPRVLRRVADRHFGQIPGALSASERRITYVLGEERREADGDVVTIEGGVAAFDGEGRQLPQACEAGLVSTATDGDAVVLGTSDGGCGSLVLLLEGDAAPRVIYKAGRDTTIRQVRLAGPWIGWRADDETITVAARGDGRVVARLRPDDFSGGRGFGGFDLDAGGRIAASTRGRVAWRHVRARGPARTIARRGSDVAIDGGRIAYVSKERVVLADLRGRALRRFDRFMPSRRPVGELALTRDRIAWAVAGEVQTRSLSAAP